MEIAVIFVKNPAFSFLYPKFYFLNLLFNMNEKIKLLLYCITYEKALTLMTNYHISDYERLVKRFGFPFKKKIFKTDNELLESVKKTIHIFPDWFNKEFGKPPNFKYKNFFSDFIKGEKE